MQLKMLRNKSKKPAEKSPLNNRLVHRFVSLKKAGCCLGNTPLSYTIFRLSRSLALPRNAPLEALPPVFRRQSLPQSSRHASAHEEDTRSRGASRTPLVLWDESDDDGCGYVFPHPRWFSAFLHPSAPKYCSIFQLEESASEWPWPVCGYRNDPGHY